MKAIAKRREPASLAQHRQTRHCDYNNYAAKTDLRNALVNEQHGLCCYCMSRIRNGPLTMKIEHWKCQVHYPTEQLKYRNLLGACLGGHRQPANLQHCDTRKGDRDLQWNPADPDHHIETRIHYEPDGSICADDEVFDDQLGGVLNLNLPVLKNNRKGVLDAVLGWWKHEKARIGGPVPRERIAEERDRRIGGNGELMPHCQVAAWWLDQKLARMGA